MGPSLTADGAQPVNGAGSGIGWVVYPPGPGSHTSGFPATWPTATPAALTRVTIAYVAPAGSGSALRTPAATIHGCGDMVVPVMPTTVPLEFTSTGEPAPSSTTRNPGAAASAAVPCNTAANRTAILQPHQPLRACMGLTRCRRNMRSFSASGGCRSVT